MPYGKKTVVTVQKSKKYGNKPRALPIAQKALKMAKNNRTFASVDFPISDSLGPSNTPDILFLSPANTDGDRQTINEIELKCFIEHNASNTGIVNWRLDLVLDRSPAKTILSLADLYETANPEPSALLTFNDRERYKLCKSYYGYFQNSIMTCRHIHFKYKSGLVSEADGGTYSQSKIQKNAYYLVYWTDVASNVPVITGTVRVVSILT